MSSLYSTFVFSNYHTTYYLLLTTYYLLLTTCYLLLSTYYLLLTAYYSLLTTYYLLLTTYRADGGVVTHIVDPGRYGGVGVAIAGAAVHVDVPVVGSG